MSTSTDYCYRSPVVPDFILALSSLFQKDFSAKFLYKIMIENNKLV